MSETSDIVKKSELITRYFEDHPILKSYLLEGFLNISSLARHLNTFLSSSNTSPVDDTLLQAALRRYKQKNEHEAVKHLYSEDQILNYFNNTENISINTNIAKYQVLLNHNDINEIITLVSDAVFSTIVKTEHNLYTVSLYLNKSDSDRLKRSNLFHLKKVNSQMASITFKTLESSVNQLGIYYYFLMIMDLKGVEIRYSQLKDKEFTLFVDREKMVNIIQAISDLT